MYPCTKCTVEKDDHENKGDSLAKEVVPTMRLTHQGRIVETIVARLVTMTHEKDDK